MSDKHNLVEYNENAYANMHSQEVHTKHRNHIKVHSERIFQEILFHNTLDRSRFLAGDYYYVDSKRKAINLYSGLDRGKGKEVVLDLNREYPTFTIPLKSGYFVDRWQREYRQWTFELCTAHRKPYLGSHEPTRSLASLYYSGDKFKKFPAKYLEETDDYKYGQAINFENAAKIVRGEHKYDANITKLIDRVIDGPGNSRYQPESNIGGGYKYDLNGGDDILYAPNEYTEQHLYFSSDHVLKSIKADYLNRDSNEFSITLNYEANGENSSLDLRSTNRYTNTRKIPVTLHLNREFVEENSENTKPFWKFNELKVVATGEWDEEKRLYVESQDGLAVRVTSGELNIQGLFTNGTRLTFEYNLPPVVDSKVDYINFAKKPIQYTELQRFLVSSAGDLYLNTNMLFRRSDANDQIQKIYFVVKGDLGFTFKARNGKEYQAKELLSKNQDIFRREDISGHVLEMPIEHSVSADGEKIARPKYNIKIARDFVEKMKTYYVDHTKPLNLFMFAKAEDKYGQLSKMAKIEQNLYFNKAE